MKEREKEDDVSHTAKHSTHRRKKTKIKRSISLQLSLEKKKQRKEEERDIEKRTHPSLLRGRCQFRRSRSAAAGERSFGERHRASSQHDEDGLFFLKKFDTSRSRVFFSSLHHGEKSFEKKNEREQFYDRS